MVDEAYAQLPPKERAERAGKELDAMATVYTLPLGGEALGLGKLGGFLGRLLGFGEKAATSPMARGVANEAKVLSEMGLTKNTQAVITAEGKSIPDALTKTASVEIKDTASRM